MDSRQRLVIAIIVVVFLSIVGGVYYYNKSKSSKTTTQNATTTSNQSISNLSNADPTDFDALTKDTYATANSKALEVNKSYKLAAIEVDVDSNLSPDTVISRYIFNSTADKNNNWVITFSSDGSSFVRALVPTADYMGTLTQMDTSLWKYNYVTALQLAEKNGGLDWRNNNKLDNITLTLKHTGANNWLIWSVVYQGNSNNKMTIQLDANSGKVVTE